MLGELSVSVCVHLCVCACVNAHVCVCVCTCVHACLCDMIVLEKRSNFVPNINFELRVPLNS